MTIPLRDAIDLPSHLFLPPLARPVAAKAQKGYGRATSGTISGDRRPPGTVLATRVAAPAAAAVRKARTAAICHAVVASTPVATPPPALGMAVLVAPTRAVRGRLAVAALGRRASRVLASGARTSASTPSSAAPKASNSCPACAFRAGTTGPACAAPVPHAGPPSPGTGHRVAP